MYIWFALMQNMTKNPSMSIDSVSAIEYNINRYYCIMGDQDYGLGDVCSADTGKMKPLRLMHKNSR